MEYGNYPPQGYNEPYDNVNMGESTGSQSTEPWGNSTDPSSENSSIDRLHTLNKLDGNDAYGNGHHNQPSPVHRTIHEEYDQPGRRNPTQPPQMGPYQTQNRNQPPGSYGPPPGQHYPQQHQHQQQQRQPIRLGAGAPSVAQQWGSTAVAPAARPSAIQRKPSEKKSWLKKRFSKS